MYKSPRPQWVIPEAKSPILWQTDVSKESELKQYIHYFSLPQGSTLWKGEDGRPLKDECEEIMGHEPAPGVL